MRYADEILEVINIASNPHQSLYFLLSTETKETLTNIPASYLQEPSQEQISQSTIYKKAQEDSSTKENEKHKEQQKSYQGK
jgi:hypothetical protein